MKKTVSILFALVLALAVSLLTVTPVFAATGHIVDNDLGAQVIGMSKTGCVQKVTITNPAGAGVLDIDCFAVTNPGGTAVDADVTDVAVYHDTNAPFGTWDGGDALIGNAASFTLATALGTDDNTLCLSVAVDATEVVFVVVTTDPTPTDLHTFLTTINGSDLAGTSVETWDGTGGIATATSATTIDAVNPTATVTTTVDPIYESALVQTVIVTYDESMDPATTPLITMTGANWGLQAVGAWDTAVFANDRYTTTLTHDGTQEEIPAEVATVASGSGATDLAGNADIGNASPPFVVDTQKPTVVIASAAPDPTNTSPIPVTATFSENVTLFVVGDIVVGNGAAGNFAGGPAIYTFDVTPAGQGQVTVDIGAGVAQDTAGNLNTAAAQFTITYDTAAPTVVITSTASPGPTNAEPIPVTATFSENVTGFVVGDIVVGNGTAASFAGGPAVYTFRVIPAGPGQVTVDIGAGVAQDTATNPNTAAAQFTITYDPTAGGGGFAPVPPAPPSPPPPPPPPPSNIEANLFDGAQSFSISNSGEVLEGITGTSGDGNLTLDIPAGTFATDSSGNPLSSLTANVDTNPPPPPSYIIGLAYDLGPDGATFIPAITLTWSYDPEALPDDVLEEDLSVEYYDEDAGEWVACPSTVDLASHTITASVSHFTTFAIIAHTIPTPPAQPLNIWVVIGIIVAAIVVFLIIFMLVRRRRA